MWEVNLGNASRGSRKRDRKGKDVNQGHVVNQVTTAGNGTPCDPVSNSHLGVNPAAAKELRCECANSCGSLTQVCSGALIVRLIHRQSGLWWLQEAPDTVGSVCLAMAGGGEEGAPGTSVTETIDGAPAHGR